MTSKVAVNGYDDAPWSYGLPVLGSGAYGPFRAKTALAKTWLDRTTQFLNENFEKIKMCRLRERLERGRGGGWGGAHVGVGETSGGVEKPCFGRNLLGVLRWEPTIEFHLMFGDAYIGKKLKVSATVRQTMFRNNITNH
jgi:hypothetical protein